MPNFLSAIRRYAPAFGLLLLAPWVGEFLLGTSPIQNLAAALVLLLPMYGGGALLIREVTRRAGRGWPTLLILGAAYGVIEACLIDQSLFNPSFFDMDSKKIAPIPLVGVNAYDSLAYIGGHAIWSIGVPIAIIELFTPSRRKVPWLGKKGLFITAILYLIGCAIVFSFSYIEEKFIASSVQLTSSAFIVVGLITTGFLLKRKNRATYKPGALIKPLYLGIGSFAVSSLYFAKPENWGGVTLGVFILIVSWLLISRWSSHLNWGIWHHFALVAGALLTYAWGGFFMTWILWPNDKVAWMGNVIFALLAIALLSILAKRIRNVPEF
ncbi:hypothetical protein [Cohnella lupini]|uniref:Uncharacterized protein n=1 Tax=Cohnella lupini TaxID=1294267 RepID=A0A3D9I0A8_9BACL|nr:hypothetical protein [Cohnella lupini]RED55071.1 hypothetical protein DFP95_1196 [Cohnella lupini]